MAPRTRRKSSGASASSIRPLKVAFLHPDLGLGGAERLVVDAAVEVASRGHAVDIYTAFYDPNRCFEETKSGLFGVSVAGNWFPRHVAGRLHALCAYVRCLLVAAWLVWRSRFGGGPTYDVVIVDQVSAVVPLLKLLLPARVLFYCHFPDLLLAQHGSPLRRLYRAPLDFVEQTTTGMADMILVNSNFTRGVFDVTFSRLAARGMQPRVLYPAVAIPPDAQLNAAAGAWRQELDPKLAAFIAGGPTFLSINRFERKKGIALAVEALAQLLAPAGGGGGGGGSGGSSSKATGAKGGRGSGGGGPRLVVAGGYDVRLAENREYLQELQALTARLGLSDRVTFVPSFTDGQRTLLLAACVGVLYTPENEHFGIVPLEAMAAGRPVVACRSGGPKESVVSGTTGFLCDPDPAAFADAMRQLLPPDAPPAAAASKEPKGGGGGGAMGDAARRHVVANFSRQAFGDQLVAHINELVSSGRKRT